MAESYELRPLTLGELLDRGFTLYRRHFGLLVGIYALPTLVPMLLLDRYRTPYAHPDGLLGMFVHFIPALLLSGLLNLSARIAVGAGSRALGSILLGEPTGVRAAFARTAPRIGDLIGLFLVETIALAAGLLLLGIPTLICAARWYVAAPALVLEDLDPLDALRRSWQLVRGHALRALGLLATYVVTATALSAGVTLPFALLRSLLPRHGELAVVAGVISRVAANAVAIAVGPLAIIWVVLFYFDLRVRKEAFDVERLLAATGEPPPAPG